MSQKHPSQKHPKNLTEVQHALIDGHSVVLVEGNTEKRISRVRHWADGLLVQLAINDRWIEARLGEIVIREPKTESTETESEADSHDPS